MPQTRMLGRVLVVPVVPLRRGRMQGRAVKTEKEEGVRGRRRIGVRKRRRRKGGHVQEKNTEDERKGEEEEEEETGAKGGKEKGGGYISGNPMPPIGMLELFRESPSKPANQQQEFVAHLNTPPTPSLTPFPLHFQRRNNIRQSGTRWCVAKTRPSMKTTLPE